MKRHHGFYGVLPGDWPRHSQPHHPGCQLCHPAAGLSHLLHTVRLPGQGPHEGVRPGQHTGAAQPVAHTPGGHAELARLLPLRAQQHGGARRAADARPEPRPRGAGAGEEKHSGLKRTKRRGTATGKACSPGLLAILFLLSFLFFSKPSPGWQCWGQEPDWLEVRNQAGLTRNPDHNSIFLNCCS